MATTNKKGYRVAKEVKEQILKRIKDDGLSVSQVSQEHGVSSQTIYAWLTKGATNNPSWTEFAKLKRENKGLLELVGSLTVKLSTAQKKN